MTEPNKISAEDIIDSWGASAHMSTAIEHLFDACNTSFITTQIQSMESAIEAVKKGAERLKGNKEKQDAAGKSVKFLRAEIHRLRKKLQRGVKHETAADRTKKPTLLDKEIKRIHKGVKKEKKRAKKEAKKNVVGKDKLIAGTVPLEKLTGSKKKKAEAFSGLNPISALSSVNQLAGKGVLTNKSLEQLAKGMRDAAPKLTEQANKLTKVLVEGAVKVNKKAEAFVKEQEKAKKAAKKATAKKGKK